MNQYASRHARRPLLAKDMAKYQCSETTQQDCDEPLALRLSHKQGLPSRGEIFTSPPAGDQLPFYTCTIDILCARAW